MPTTENKCSLLDAIDGLLDLRPFPTAASQLMAACEKESTTVRDLSEIIKCDPGLSLKLLQIANSPLYGLSGEIRSVDHATVILGMRALRDLAVSAAVGDVFGSGDATTNQVRQKLWMHSLACGVTARVLCQQTGVASPDEAFLGGVVHDVGKLLFLDHEPVRYIELMEKKQNTIGEEEDVFGVTHTRIGQKCGESWGLPDEINDVITFHHDPESADFGGDLVNVVAASNRLSKIWTEADCDPDEAVCTATLIEAGIDLAPEELAEIRNQVHDNLETMKQICA